MNDKIKQIALEFLGENYKVVLLRKTTTKIGNVFKEYALVEEKLGTKLIFGTANEDKNLYSVHSVDSGTFANQYFCKKWVLFVEAVEKGE